MPSAFTEVTRSFCARAAAATAIPFYTHVPQDLASPYGVVTSDSSTSADTKTYSGIEHAVQLDIYSSARGLEEVKALMGLLYDDLQRRPIAVTGYNSSPPQFEFSDAFIEPDGARGVMRFSVRTTPEG